MGKQFEYRVCQVQYSHVSYVNGAWQGQVESAKPKAIESCPAAWDYLNLAGREGWELVGVVNMLAGEGNNFQQIYLKRETG